MNRRKLSPTASVTEFDAYYRLKSDLIDFCRQNRLPVGGSKMALAERIRQFLSDGKAPSAPAAKRPVAARMPEQFSREMLIGPNWRCSQPLRLFLEAEIGPRFHFDAFMRDFIKNGAGKPLQEAIEGWLEQERAPRLPVEIAPQFEYNRFIRAYFETNKNKTLAEAVAAWNAHKIRERV